jgi:hypothetical protein
MRCSSFQIILKVEISPMKLSSLAKKNVWRISLVFSFAFSIILSNYPFSSLIYVYGQPNSYYDQEIELAYGIPTQLSNVSVPADNIFESHSITGFSLSANYSNNSGIIWINDSNNETIWSDQLDEAFEIYIKINNTSIRRYSLWANSSALGNNTLYYSFRPDIIHAGNWAIIIVIFFIPFIVVAALVIALLSKKKPHSVRFAEKIVDRMATKYQKHRITVPKLCPECGNKIRKQDDKFCSECGSMIDQ